MKQNRNNSPNGQDTLHLISHTHWDREFYFSFQRFRYRLVHVVNELLDYLPDHPSFRYYHLDGQTSVVDDYAEVEHERKEELFARIAEGRILIGPWYVLADQFKVSGEAVIRNLLIGGRHCREFGGKMNIGYLPDLFGHIGQMPQILRGFGMSEAVIWRGISDRGDDLLPGEWIWEGTDGSRVLAVHLPDRHGYTNGFALPHDPEGLREKLDQLYDELKPYAGTSHMLIMNGMDHQSAHLPIPELLDRINRENPRYRVIHSSLPEYVRQQRIGLDEQRLQVRTGEFRSTNHGKTSIFNFVVPNVLSSRIHLAQWNERMQTLLERWAEPFSVMASWQGHNYPRTLLRTAWKYLLQNHPHDSICGTSLDDAPRQMITRFEWVRDIGDQARAESLHALSGSFDPTGGVPDSRIVRVFNPLQYTVSEVVEMEVPFPEELPFKDVILMDDTGAEIPVKLLSISNRLHQPDYMSYWPPALSGMKRMAHIAFRAEDVPAFGSRSYRLRSVERPNRRWVRFSESAAVPTMENDYLLLKFHPNGSFDLLEKTSGKQYNHLHIFEDGADIGDTYTYSESNADRIFSTYGERASFRQIEHTAVRNVYEITIPWLLPVRYDPVKQERASERIECQLTSRISLAAGARRVDVETWFDNKAEDHRLRVLFPTGLRTETADAAGSFEVTRRPIRVKQPEREVWLEDEPVTFPHKGFVDLNDGTHGFALIAPGIMEYEVMHTEERSIALTLLRAVGYLGAGNRPLTILHGAGPHVETPDAQCKGIRHYRYSLYPHSGDWQEGRVMEQTQRFITGLYGLAYPEADGASAIPAMQSMLRIGNRELVFSALKLNEQGQGSILRFYNPTRQLQTTEIAVQSAMTGAYLVDLQENRLERLTMQTTKTAEGIWSSIEIRVGPGKILGIEWESNADEE